MDQRPSVLVALGRGLTRRCPRCGARGVFTRWFRLAPSCPVCGLTFEQEEGYWLGAVMLNTGLTEGMFLIVFVAGMVLTWPDVPWTGLLVAGIAVTLTFPPLLDPITRTTWVALERSARSWSETDVPYVPVRQPRQSQERIVSGSSDETVA